MWPHLFYHHKLNLVISQVFTIFAKRNESLRKMKKYLAILIIGVLAISSSAQQRVVSEVKKSIEGMTLSVDNIKGAMNRLKPALTNDETKGLAETWYVAGRVQYRLYDKYMSNRAIGQKVDVKAMGHALIDGYDYFDKALKLDTTIEEKNGRPVIDRKTMRPKVKTKYSQDIVHRINERMNDYNKVGGELYNVKDWGGAYQAWEIFCQQAQRSGTIPDTILGQTRYFQAITRWQQNDNRNAADLFEQARNLGYNKKEAFDYALVCLSALNDDAGIVKTAAEAYETFGTADLQYIRILINNYINKEEYAQASELLDKAIAVNDDDAELHNLKGLVVEQQDGIDAAFTHFKSSVELDPDNAQAQFNMGRYYYNQAATVTDKNPDLSRKDFNKKVQPLYRQAMPYFEKALQLEPGNEEVKNALRNIYYKLGEGKKLEALDRK